MMSGSFVHRQNSGSPRRLPRMVVLFWRHVDDFYDIWDRNEDFFGQVVEYYEDGKEVKCYEKGGECSSDED